MRCRPGDLAIVVRATVLGNVGKIVRVLKRYDGSSGLSLENAGPAWLVKSSAPLTWRAGSRRYRRKYGPVLDCNLQPIRGSSGHTILLSTSAYAPSVLVKLTDPPTIQPRHRPNPID